MPLAGTYTGVTIEVPFAGESGPPSEDGKGNYLAFGEGWFWAGAPFGRMGLAEGVHHDVECGKEGVLKTSIRSRFLSFEE
jgi:hypothetical protein